MVGKTSILLACGFSGLATARLMVIDALDGTLCQKQSCDIADISRSSGRPFNLAKAQEIKKAYPASAATCIESYYYKLNIPIPEGYVPSTKPPAGYNPKPAKRAVASAAEQMTAEAPVEKSAACNDYALFYARGSLEPASTNNMGITLGSGIQKAVEKGMPGKWHTQGIDYPAALMDNFCVGMPGGYNCVQQLTKYAEACPNTKIALAGYSQGGMVVRNCAAFVSDEIRNRIVAVVGLGDPFNGAPVKGLASDKVKSICYSQDGVCGGELNIGLYHGAYLTDSSVSTTAQFILSKSRG